MTPIVIDPSRTRTHTHAPIGRAAAELLRNRSASRLSRLEPAGSRARPLDFHATRRPSSRAIPFYMTLLRQRRGKPCSRFLPPSLFMHVSFSLSSSRYISFFSSHIPPVLFLSHFFLLNMSTRELYMCLSVSLACSLARSRTLILAASHFGHTARWHACEAGRGEAKCGEVR